MVKLRIVILYIFIISSLSSCSVFNKDETWVAVLTGIPKEIKPSMSHSLLVSYVLKQTHEPLLKKDKNSNYYSDIIEKWQRSVDHKQIEFCLLKDKYFDETTKFTSDDLAQFLKAVIENNKLETPSIIKKENCIQYSFNKPQEKLLELLTFIGNAPTHKSNIPDIENGLGAYFVTELDSKKILLKRKINSSTGFNKIEFLNINNLTTEQLNSETIKDYNFVSGDKIPDWVKVKYLSFNITTLKTRALFINIPDAEMRDKIFNCMDIKSLRTVIFGSKTPMIDIASILPMGIVGASPGTIKQKCSTIVSLATKKKFNLILWDIPNKNGLESLLESFFKKTGINIIAEYHSYNELLDFIYKKRSNYNLIPLAIDTKVPSYEQYFESFGDSNKTHFSFMIPDVVNTYKQVTASENTEEKKKYALKLQDLILSNHLVLPLYQISQTFYYPKYLKNILVGFDYLDFPDIGRIEI